MKLALIVLLLMHFSSFSQNQNNQWRFGFGSAIDFNTTPPTYPTGCALPTVEPPFLNSNFLEGTASIADKNSGELLFYTDGQTVWNKLNQPMPNGSGLEGSDYNSAYMGTIIVPVPGSCSKYYIFCADDGEDATKGITYSVIDMSLNNGLGDVLAGQKGISLYTNVSEMLIAYPKSSGDGYWIITNGNDLSNPTLVAFELTASGISTSPVSSNLLVFAITGKINPQGTKFVTVGDAGIDIYDFNATTGQFSNPISVLFSLLPNDLLKYFEFSPNGNYLFATGDLNMFQFDITSNNPISIAASATFISFGIPGGDYGAPQLGPDGNLYVVKSSFVYCIENPNTIGLITALPNSITTMVALPQWIYMLPENNEIETINLASDSCIQSVQEFSISSTSEVNSISWDFGEPSSGLDNNSTETSPSHQYSDVGIYTVTAFVEFDCKLDTIVEIINLVDCQIPEPPIAEDFTFPNVITPNSDGINDLFEVANLPENTEVLILNRWGNVVFSSANYQNNWGGKDTMGNELVNGVYTYKFTTELGKVGHGFVHLVR